MLIFINNYILKTSDYRRDSRRIHIVDLYLTLQLILQIFYLDRSPQTFHQVVLDTTLTLVLSTRASSLNHLNVPGLLDVTTTKYTN